MTTKQDLERYACDLANHYRASLSPEAKSQGWPMVWKDLTRKLRSRYPGFLELEYAIALNQGFVNAERCEIYAEANSDQAVDSIDLPRFA